MTNYNNRKPLDEYNENKVSDKPTRKLSTVRRRMRRPILTTTPPMVKKNESNDLTAPMKNYKKKYQKKAFNEHKKRKKIDASMASYYEKIKKMKTRSQIQVSRNRRRSTTIKPRSLIKETAIYSTAKYPVFKTTKTPTLDFQIDESSQFVPYDKNEALYNYNNFKYSSIKNSQNQ